jgi:hypothetical protein
MVRGTLSEIAFYKFPSSAMLRAALSEDLRGREGCQSPDRGLQFTIQIRNREFQAPE